MRRPYDTARSLLYAQTGSATTTCEIFFAMLTAICQHLLTLWPSGSACRFFIEEGMSNAECAGFAQSFELGFLRRQGIVSRCLFESGNPKVAYRTEHDGRV